MDKLKELAELMCSDNHDVLIIRAQKLKVLSYD